jgi:hypothetical protein
MGAVSNWYFREGLGGKTGVSAAHAAKIVTPQHNDYTGRGKGNIEGWESPIKILKGVSILSRPFPPRASMPHI